MTTFKKTSIFFSLTSICPIGLLIGAILTFGEGYREVALADALADTENINLKLKNEKLRNQALRDRQTSATELVVPGSSNPVIPQNKDETPLPTSAEVDALWLARYLEMTKLSARTKEILDSLSHKKKSVRFLETDFGEDSRKTEADIP